MPKIELSNGFIKYKTVPLYGGVKLIDKEKALENLLLVKKILDERNVPFQLAYGTLLGAIRDKDFITHDEDIDLIVLEEYKQTFIDTLPILIEEGFAIARYDRRGLMSIIRNGEYIDFYFFAKAGNGLRTCSGAFCIAKHIEEVAPLVFKGIEFLAPKEYEDFFLFEYGENWRTPVQYHNFEMSKSHRYILSLKEHLKDILPDWLYFRLAKRAENSMTEQYNEKLKRYNILKNGF